MAHFSVLRPLKRVKHLKDNADVIYQLLQEFHHFQAFSTREPLFTFSANPLAVEMDCD